MPPSAMLGTESTPSAWAVTTVTWTLIPGSTPAGTESMADQHAEADHAAARRAAGRDGADGAVHIRAERGDGDRGDLGRLDRRDVGLGHERRRHHGVRRDDDRRAARRDRPGLMFTAVTTPASGATRLAWARSAFRLARFVSALKQGELGVRDLQRRAAVADLGPGVGDLGGGHGDLRVDGGRVGGRQHLPGRDLLTHAALTEPPSSSSRSCRRWQPRRCWRSRRPEPRPASPSRELPNASEKVRAGWSVPFATTCALTSATDAVAERYWICCLGGEAGPQDGVARDSQADHDQARPWRSTRLSSILRFRGRGAPITRAAGRT